MDFDYKKYSLGNIEKWVRDALTSAEASPQEIYDTIKGVVDEEYHYFKHYTSRCYELLCLLNGNGKGHWFCDNDDGMKPWGHSDLEYGLSNDILTKDRVSNFPGEQYTESEMNAMCDKAASDDEKNKCREYNLREAEYYNKRAELDAEQNHSQYYYDYTRNDLNKENPFVKKSDEHN